ncbi:MAG: TolC family protein [Bacteroidales bacterium]|nr:TolC family protein [Bacteroidales bacterium]
MKRIITILYVCLAVTAANAQSLNYGKFINDVYEGNLEYAAEKLNLPLAEAELMASRMFLDPVVGVSYGNNSDWDIMMGQSVEMELSKTISLGKRAARIDYAKQALSATEAALQDYLRNLRADATLCYLGALLARDLLQIEKQVYDNLSTLSSTDSVRFMKGDISQLDAIQTHLEANIAKQEYYSKQAEYNNILVYLDQISGNPLRGSSDITGKLKDPERLFILQDLIAEAVENREDVLLALKNANLAESELRMIRIERNPDIDLILGANYNTRVCNEEAPAPEFIGYSVGLSIPLPLSNLNKGQIKSGQVRVQQARLQADNVKNTVMAEIVQAYNNYESARIKVADYDSLLMESAKKVLDGRMYAYTRGEISLLEVLNAQSTYSDVAKSYAEILHDCMAAWVELERSAGIWDIEL